MLSAWNNLFMLCLEPYLLMFDWSEQFSCECIVETICFVIFRCDFLAMTSVHLKGSLRYLIFCIRPFAMSLSVHLGPETKVAHTEGYAKFLTSYKEAYNYCLHGIAQFYP